MCVCVCVLCCGRYIYVAIQLYFLSLFLRTLVKFVSLRTESMVWKKKILNLLLRLCEFITLLSLLIVKKIKFCKIKHNCISDTL